MSSVALALLVLAGSTVLAGTTYIRAGSIFDGQYWLGAGVIVVADSMVVAVEDSASAIPAGASVIVALDCTVLPGFRDYHVQLVAPPHPWAEDIERYGTGRITAEEMSAYPRNRLDLLRCGVTAVTDIGSPLGTQLGMKKALERGSIIGPLLEIGGPLFTAPGGIPVSTTFAGHHDWIDFATCQVKDTLTARRRVDELARQGVDAIALVHDGTGGAPQLDRAVAAAICDEALHCSLGCRSVSGSELEAAKRRLTDVAGISPLEEQRAHSSSWRLWGCATEIHPGRRADLVFYKGLVADSELTTDRIERVMLGGKTVIENGRVPKEMAYGFRRKVLDGIAYPYWDPLLSFLFGGSITNYDLFGTGTTASADLLYSTRNMWFTNVSFLPPSPIPRTALRVAAHFDNQNRLFYVLGNDAPLDSAVEYRNIIFRELVGTATRIGREWKATGSVLFDQTRLRQYGSKILPDGLAGRNGGNELMVSLSLVHDTRDHQVNPWHGHYVGAGVLAAPAVFPNGHAFGRAFAEARGYASVGHHHILAGRVVYQQAFGDVPFYHLPEFGGDTLGRGYLPFRFRDRAAVIGQFEYRFPIWSSISGVAFVDVGQFQPRPGSFSISGFHPAIGFGPRVCFGANESRMIGVDVGFTPEGWNLVLHNGQVF
jgi:hypothetical protein